MDVIGGIHMNLDGIMRNFSQKNDEKLKLII
jgi:hypothetical protein